MTQAPDGRGEVLRLFVAIVPSSQAVSDLAAALTPLRRDLDLRWTPSEQWHVTLLFAEAVPRTTLGPLTGAFGDLTRQVGPLRLGVSGAGAFPRERRARVLWAGVEVRSPAGGPGPLGGLAADLHAVAASHGVRTSAAPFRAHLTVARARPSRDLSSAVAALAGYRGPSWTPQRAVLVRSRPGAGPGGRALHEELSRLPLRTA